MDPPAVPPIAHPALAPYQARYARDAAHQPLRVTLSLASPLAGYDPLNLDNLLARAVVDEATAGQGVPHASAAYVLPVPLRRLWRSDDGLPLWAATPFVPAGVSAVDVAVLHKRQQVGEWTGTPSGHLNLASAAGRWMERRMPLPTTVAEAWTADAIGDASEIARLLARVSHVGKRRAAGFGVVVRWEVAPWDAWSLVRDGRLTRALPAEAVRLLDGGLPAGTPAPVGWTPPQWKPDLFRSGWWPGTPVDAA